MRQFATPLQNVVSFHYYFKSSLDILHICRQFICPSVKKEMGPRERIYAEIIKVKVGEIFITYILYYLHRYIYNFEIKMILIFNIFQILFMDLIYKRYILIMEQNLLLIFCSNGEKLVTYFKNAKKSKFQLFIFLYFSLDLKIISYLVVFLIL